MAITSLTVTVSRITYNTMGVNAYNQKGMNVHVSYVLRLSALIKYTITFLTRMSIVNSGTVMLTNMRLTLTVIAPSLCCFIVVSALNVKVTFYATTMARSVRRASDDSEEKEKLLHGL